MSAIDEEAKALLDALDFDARCEIVLAPTRREWLRKDKAGRCPLAAQWRIQCQHCDLDGLMCDGHAQEVARHDVIRCMRCRASGSVSEVFLITPLPAV